MFALPLRMPTRSGGPSQGTAEASRNTYVHLIGITDITVKISGYEEKERTLKES